VKRRDLLEKERNPQHAPIDDRFAAASPVHKHAAVNSRTLVPQNNYHKPNTC